MIAGICAILVTLYLFRRDISTAQPALLVSISALTYSALLAIENESNHEKVRSELYAHAREIAKPIPDNALILTTLPVLTLHAQQQGTSIMVPLKGNIEEAIRAADAFALAGRCVYFHNPIVTNLLEPQLPNGTISKVPSWAGRDAFPGDARMAFFTLTSQTERCSF